MKTVLLAMAALLAVPTTSDADSRKACAALCGRLTSCKLMTHGGCMDLCMKDPHADDASTFTQAKLSCSALANQMAPSKWLCTAEGSSSYGRDMDTGLADEWGTKDIFMLGTGKTRDAASWKAMSDCMDIMSLHLDNDQTMYDDSSWGTAVASKCHITQCIAPASGR